MDLLPSTKTLALLCSFSTYDTPSKSTRKQLPTLERIEPAMQRLQSLLASDRCIAAGIQTEVLPNLSMAELLERLEEIRDALEGRFGVDLVVFWSGHGNIHEKSFRLAVRNTSGPIKRVDGIGLGEVMWQSGVEFVRTWTLFLDACFAGEGLDEVFSVAQRVIKSESGTLQGYGAYFSCSPFEKALDSIFLETVVSLLEQGPSESAKNYVDSETKDGKDTFGQHYNLLSNAELFESIYKEYKADSRKYGNTKPWAIQFGVAPMVFPNPKYDCRRSSRLVNDDYRSIARTSDVECHFFPKARGIENLESGWYFVGRVEATRAILNWMNRPADMPANCLYVLAADGGAGKSALLGRLIALTDRQYRDKAKTVGWDEELDQKAGTVPQPDRIDAALSLRNLTPQTLAEHLADLLGIGHFRGIESFVTKAAQSYRRQDNAAPCIVLDALDEALEPPPIIFRIIRPLAQAGWKLLVATRRTVRAKGASDLLADLGEATVFELDRDQQSRDDIYVYTRNLLRSKRADLAEPAAKLIADRADRKFLFARIAAASLLRRADQLTLDQLPAAVAQDATDALTQELTALNQEFQHNFARSDDGATAMIAALAWSEGDGVPVRDGIWMAMAGAMASLNGPSPEFEERHILWLLSEAGRFIQESGDGDQAVYRLFHKSLVDYFHQGGRGLPEPADVTERVVGALLNCVKASRDWAYTNPYLIRHLPVHLAKRPEQRGLNRLLQNFDWIQARLNLSGIHVLLSDYLLCRNAYPANARLHRTLSMVAHILQQHPDQLIPQLIGRIAPGVPDMSPLLAGRPGANYSLPPPSHEGLSITAQLMLRQPSLDIDQREADLIDRTLSLDGFLERAKASMHESRWIPLFGGLAQASSLVYTLPGHRKLVKRVALSADGCTAVSVSDDGMACVWNAQTGQSLFPLNDHPGRVFSVALSADGNTMVTGSDNGTVRLWKTQTREIFCTLQDHEGSVASVALSADGCTVVAGDGNGRVRLWNHPQSGQAPRILHGPGVKVSCVALSADGCTVVAGCGDGTVRVWDAQSGQAQRPLRSNEGAITHVALSADGCTMVASSVNGTVQVWDTHSGQAQQSPLQSRGGKSISVAMSADGCTVATSSSNGTVRVWDAQNGRALRALQGHEGSVYCVALSADSRTVVSGGADRTVRVWDTQTVETLLPRQAHESKLISVALSADGGTVVSGGANGTVCLWNAQNKNGKTRRTPNDHEGRGVRVALSADGRTMVVGSGDGKVHVWDEQCRDLRLLHGHKGVATCVALSADGITVVAGIGDGTVRVWKAQTGQAQRPLRSNNGAITHVALSADGCTMVASSANGTVQVWDTHSGQPLPALQDHEGRVSCVALSADGRTVVAGINDGTVHVWDSQTGLTLHTLKGHENSVNCVALSTDGRTVVSGGNGNDCTVRVWDTQTGRLLETLTLDAAVMAVALATWADQSTMAVASGTSVVRLARLPGRTADVMDFLSPPPSH